jgi:hypothetical protein
MRIKNIKSSKAWKDKKSQAHDEEIQGPNAKDPSQIEFPNGYFSLNFFFV